MTNRLRLLQIIFFLLFNITSFGQCVTTPVSNLVINGNFSSGNTLFTSGYSYCTNSNCLYPEGYYSIGTNANFYHGAFVGRDHTTGTGNFMIVNGTGVPNTIVWSQDITVKPNTNYNFSAWVMTLVASSPAKLQFQINGVTIGSVFDAPMVTQTWQNFADSWFSGSSTTATITILNQNTTLSGNDFGIDDISFLEICGTPQPNLGPDQLLCGVGTVTLDSNVPHTATANVTWSDGTSGTGLGAPYTKTFSTAGTYWVCVQDGSCFKTDTIHITANFSIDIGPDFTLCASTAVKLDAGYGNSFTTYQWFKDNSPLSDSTQRTFTVRSPGTYRVEVTDASCSLTRFDEVIVNAVSALPQDGIYCPPAQAKFEVIPNPTGGFKWYDSPVEGTFVGRGNVLNMTTTGTTTMYAEDTTAFQYEVGPNSKFPAGSEDAGNAMNYIEFDALSSFTLNEITVWAKVYSPNESYTIGVQLRDNAGNLVGTPVVRTVTGPPIVPANRDWPFTITLGMGVPAGNGYRLTNEGTVGNILFWARGANPAGSVDWASYRVNGVIALKGLDAGYNYCNGTCYGFAYNWKISKGNNCARVPVTVVEECPLPLAWLDFTVEKLNESALLNWSTVDEKNTSHFVIERSTNGKNYKAIGQKNAYGQIYNNHYHFEDKTPAKGTVYYRIAQYDRDGAYTYSSIRTIENKNTEIIAYPTKHNGQFSLHVSALPMEESVIDVYLFNTTGTEVYKQRHQVVGGLLNTEINISDFANGIYLIKVSTNDGIYTAKCIKE